MIAVVRPNAPTVWVDPCVRKIGYSTRARARQSATEREKATGRPMRVYRCDRCRGWHLTSMVTR